MILRKLSWNIIITNGTSVKSEIFLMETTRDKS